VGGEQTEKKPMGELNVVGNAACTSCGWSAATWHCQLKTTTSPRRKTPWCWGRQPLAEPSIILAVADVAP
jgi:hypothetical protein